MERSLVLGTRGSALALWQARHVRERLQQVGRAVELKVIQTEGDLQQSTPLTSSDVGVFVRRIEQELLAGSIDFAVHSLKDLPTTQPEGLELRAVLARHDPRDALLTVGGGGLDALRQGAVIGTGSPRRRMQLARHRPDLEIRPLRGNVDTRIRRLVAGDFDAIVLAVAGVERLGIDQVAVVPIAIEQCLPAVGQGALAIETRADDETVSEAVAVLDDRDSALAVAAERACLRRLGGGCLAPATAYARVTGEGLRLQAAVGAVDGSRLLQEGATGPAEAGGSLGERVADRLLAAGAGELLAAARSPA